MSRELRWENISGSATRWTYDGLEALTERDENSTLERRFVWGPGIDEPIVWYEGGGTTDRRWLHADERGSVIAVSDGTGAVTGINRYDEYGVPAPANVGRFQYTGQAWLPETAAYYYKTRFYDPVDGRFLQNDKIGYLGGMNLYAYVGNDPVNFVDPLGTDPEPRSICNFAGSICTVNGVMWDEEHDYGIGEVRRQTCGYGYDFATGAITGGDCDLGYAQPMPGWAVTPQYIFPSISYKSFGTSGNATTSNPQPAYCSSREYQALDAASSAGSATAWAGVGLFLGGAAVTFFSGGTAAPIGVPMMQSGVFLFEGGSVVSIAAEVNKGYMGDPRGPAGSAAGLAAGRVLNANPVTGGAANIITDLAIGGGPCG